MTRTAIQVDTLQVVYTDNESPPLIGVDSPDTSLSFSPWQWDDRIWTDKDYENSDLAIPVLGDTSIRGLSKTYFQPGIGDGADLEILDTKVMRQESIDHWTVRIRHGEYFGNNVRRYLFADRSEVQYVDKADNEDSRNVLELDQVPRHSSPIWATIWQRDSLGDPYLYKFIYKRQIFSGEYDSDGEKDTVDENGDVVWDNVDLAKDEFIVVWPTTKDGPPTLYFNKDYTFLVGLESLSHADDLDYCDFIGVSTGNTDQVLFTKYFPLHDGTVVVYYDTYDNEAPEAEYDGEGNLINGADCPYEIDLDRGEITFPGTPPAAGAKIYIKYETTIEVEYEPEYCNNYRTADEINLNPIISHTDRGFLYLTGQDLRVAYITLESDAPEIQDDIYGPLDLGSGYCFLIATAYNARGQPVPGAEVSIYLDTQTSVGINGYINGASASPTSPVTGVTDANGQFRVVYSAPRSIESAGQYILHSSYTDNADTLTVLWADGITASALEDVYVYQVYDDDRMQPWTIPGLNGQPGYGGRKVVLYKWTKEGELGGGETGERNWQDVDGITTYIHPRTGEIGTYMPICPIAKSGNDLVFANDLPFTEDSATPWEAGISYLIGDPVWHNPTINWYISLSDHTSSLENEPPNVTYWEPTTSSAGSLVAYWLASGRQISVYAKCYSYLYNNWVYASPIELRLSIPDYMKGTYVVDDITSITRTPYGFRIHDNNSAASGLGGATYLSINPAVGIWPVLWEGEATGEYEDAGPFAVNSIGYTFTVNVL